MTENLQVKHKSKNVINIKANILSKSKSSLRLLNFKDRFFFFFFSPLKYIYIQTMKEKENNVSETKIKGRPTLTRVASVCRYKCKNLEHIYITKLFSVLSCSRLW